MKLHWVVFLHVGYPASLDALLRFSVHESEIVILNLN